MLELYEANENRGEKYVIGVCVCASGKDTHTHTLVFDLIGKNERLVVHERPDAVTTGALENLNHVETLIQRQ